MFYIYFINLQNKKKINIEFFESMIDDEKKVNSNSKKVFYNEWYVPYSKRFYEHREG